MITWPPRGMNTGLFGDTWSSSKQVGMRPSSRMLSCQPDEAVTHCPGGVCATLAAIAFCTSAIEREDRSWTAGEFNAAKSWCRCVSISPGTTVRPLSSTICVDGPASGAIAAWSPSATKRPSRMATASAMRQLPSTVMMRPPRRIRSAGWAAAPVASANAPKNTVTARRRARWSCMAILTVPAEYPARCRHRLGEGVAVMLSRINCELYGAPQVRIHISA